MCLLHVGGGGGAEIHYAGFSDEASTRVRVCFVAALAHLHDLTLPPPTCFEERPSILPANAATLAKLLRPVRRLPPPSANPRPTPPCPASSARVVTAARFEYVSWWRCVALAVSRPGSTTAP
jgi:hypothetical protein